MGHLGPGVCGSAGPRPAGPGHLVPGNPGPGRTQGRREKKRIGILRSGGRVIAKTKVVKKGTDGWTERTNGYRYVTNDVFKYTRSTLIRPDIDS